MAVANAEKDYDAQALQLMERLASVYALAVRRHWNQEEMRRTRVAAEAASRAKSDFLANMSHELRTPLNAVLGFSQMLQEEYIGTLNEKQQQYVGDILDSGAHLLGLIDDVLELSTIEAGRLSMELSEVAVESFLARSLTLIREKATAHGGRLWVESEGEGKGSRFSFPIPMRGEREERS